MSGPWVNYQAPAAPSGDGPWSKYGASPPVVEKEPAGFWDKVKTALQSKQVPQSKFDPNSPLPGSTEGHGMLGGLAEWDKASGGEIGGGVGDILKGDVAKGLHRIISGTGSATVPAAALVAAPLAAAAPLTTALSLGGGMAGQTLGQKAASAMGASPDQAALAGDVGGLAGGYAGAKLPAVAGRAALLGRTPEAAYQSALKPSTTIPPAKVAQLVGTGLKEGIPVSPAGAEKLSSLIDDVNDKIAAEIQSDPTRPISKGKVLQRLNSVVNNFSQQVTPASDLNAVAEAGQEFDAAHPADISAADAQAMKQGTYRQLSSKAYGEIKSASIESQKALARGLKEELATAFPELNNLNAQDSKLLNLQPILEKAIQRQGNHQIIGIGSPITAGATKAVTGSSALGAVTGVLKVIVDNPAVKSRLAIALAKSGSTIPEANARIQAYSSALGASAANSEVPDDRNSQ